jgi:TonB family protein
MAQTLFPKTADSDLSMFGAPGELLKQNLLANPRPEKCASNPEAMARPRVEKRVEPSYPRGAREFRERGIVIIEIKIGADGLPSEPRIVKPLSAPLSYAALESLRNWTFTPATVDGKPVESTFCMTINFKLN